MSRKLAKLLDQPERLVARTIDKLESLNGYNSEDARLLAENNQSVRTKISDLGLDPDDTTGEELHQALLVKFQSDSALIDKAVGISSESNAEQRLDKAIQLLEHLGASTENWYLKHSAAKNLLRDQVPHKLMKQLGYRSVDSLLKRQDVNSIYLMLPSVESASWQKNFQKKLARLSGSDYEFRAPQFAKSSSTKAFDDLIGAIALPMPDQADTSSVLALALSFMDRLADLTGHETDQFLANLHPALLWWEQAKSLMALCGQDVVSLNLKDTALNYQSQNPYGDRSLKHGQKSLWNELTSRYQNQVAEAEEYIAAAEDNAAQEIRKVATRQLPKELAVEYAEAIANEF